MTLPTEAETLLRKCSGFQSISPTFLIACAANFGVADIDEDVGAGRLELDDMVVDGRLRGLEAFFRDDHGSGLVAETVLQALQVVLAVIVVLIEHGDLGVGLFLQNIFGVDPRLALVARLPAHGPREVLRIVPLGGAGGDEKLRHLLGVHVFVDRRIGRRAERIEDEQNLVALDELARLLDRLGRAIAVVIADEVDLAAVDAAGVVDHLEIGGLGLADHAISGSRPAIGHDIADLDFGVGRAGVVFLLRQRAAARCRQAVRTQQQTRSQFCSRKQS